MSPDIGSQSLSSRVVLLCVTGLTVDGETPAHTGEIIQATKKRLDDVDADTLGKLQEAEVNRALNRLEADDLVEIAETGDQSPTGKGRPAYTLAVDVTDVIDALANDDEVGQLANRIAAETS